MRYQEWWWNKLPEEFVKRKFDVITLGANYIQHFNDLKSTPEMFSPINVAIELEAEQIKQYMNLELKDDDILFWSDNSFPGIFGHVLFHKKPKKMYAFCHATSLNKHDYYEGCKDMKFPIETSISKMFDKIFIGSIYHQRKLAWSNTIVTYLPFPPMEGKPINTTKTIDIMSASRPSVQKVNSELEATVEKSFNLQIKRFSSSTWNDYYTNLNNSKILLITAHEDTFGYQIVDAVINNCIPLARTDCAYPELLPREFLYANETELKIKIDHILNSNIGVEIPKLLCEEQMKNFYDTICKEMKNDGT